MPADSVIIVNELIQHLNKWPDKPCRFSLEVLPNDAPALMLQPLAGSAVERKYIDGSFIGTFPFSVYFRNAQTDTHDKLSAYDSLEKLAFWLENSPLPVLNGKRSALSIEQSATPSLAFADDDTEDYQTMFTLRYKQSS